MNTTLRIGSKEFNARTSGLTEVIYRELFGKDLKIEMSKMKVENSKNMGIFKELAFVMVWQAMPRDKKTSEAMKELKITDYYEWLDEETDERDFLDAETLAGITNTWLKSQESNIAIKN